MRCRRASQLIALAPETQLSPAEARSLQSHLRACQRCRAHQLRMTAGLTALRADADSVAADSIPSSGYHDALHRRLLEADRAINARPAAAVDRLVARALEPTSLLPIRARQALAGAALLLMLTLISAAHISRPADLPAPECRLGHMPSLRVQVSPNGRVYASLAMQSALSRRANEEAMP